MGDAFTNNPATRTAHSKQLHRREISCSKVSRYSHGRHLVVGIGRSELNSLVFFGNSRAKKTCRVRFFSIYFFAALQLIGLDSK